MEHCARYLKEVGKVDQHVGTCLLLAAGYVKADGNNVESFAPFREFMLDGEGVHPCCSQAHNIRQSENIGYTLYPLACCGKGCKAW